MQLNKVLSHLMICVITENNKTENSFTHLDGYVVIEDSVTEECFTTILQLKVGVKRIIYNPKRLSS